ncbi:hypothetical protein [Streptomyces virginiae]|uniref:hypothetical protein n=1 Tax=Streptomyces virginiae TaxID=1961 RepID=UPI0030E46B72
MDVPSEWGGRHRVTGHFVGQVLADEPTNVTRALEAMRDEHLERSRARHSVVGAHR